jgi:hypothetical protein
MTSTPPRPCPSAATSVPITFSSSARPRIGGVTSPWPPTSKRPVEDPTGCCPVYRLLDRHCSACHSRHPPIHAEYTSMLRSVHAIRAATRPRHPNISGDDHEVSLASSHCMAGMLSERPSSVICGVRIFLIENQAARDRSRGAPNPTGEGIAATCPMFLTRASWRLSTVGWAAFAACRSWSTPLRRRADIRCPPRDPRRCADARRAFRRT